MKYFLLLFSGIIINSIAFSQVSTPFTTSGTWTCPAGVTSVTVECWGGGGTGGGSTNNTQYGGGGGAGGSYAKKVVTVIPGNTYTVNVGATLTGLESAGAKGNPSWFGATTTVYAEGGAGGSAPNGGTSNGGIGSSVMCIGDFVYAGGNGGNGSAAVSGGGGGGGGSTGAGGNASGITGGTGTTLNGGNGRTGRNNTEGNGQAGATYGGGGSGAFIPDNTNHAGGNGAAGYVVISYAALCTPAPTSVDGIGITNVTLNSINNTTGVEAGNYGDYTAQIATVTQGVTETCYITFSTGYTYVTKIWVDWNNDLDFADAGEEVYSGTSLATNPTTLTATFTVPAGASLGNHRMRIGGADVGPPTPCYTGSYASFEDYTLNVVVASAMTYTSCTTTQLNTATVAPGATTQEIVGIHIVTAGVSSPLQVTSFTVNANGSTNINDINGATAKIYYTGTNSTFATTTLFGGTTPTIANFNIAGTQTLSSGTNYFWLVYDIKAGATVGNFVDGECTSLNVGGARTPTVTAPVGNRLISLSYCASVASYTADEDILNVTFATLNNSSTCATTGGVGSILNRYSNYTGVAAPNAMQGSTVSFSVEVGTCGGTYSNGCAIWIDYNKDGDFADAGEKVYNAASTTSGAHTESGNIIIPLTAIAGTTRMRVICSESSVPTDPCAAYSYGETEDYFVNIIAAAACAGPPTAGTTSALPTPICPGEISDVTLAGYTVASGITFQWQFSPDNVSWTDIAGANSTTFTTPALTSSTYYRCRVTCTNSALSANSSSVQVVVQLNAGCYCNSAATSTSDMDITNVTFGTINNSSATVSLTGTQGTAGGTAGLKSNWWNSTVPVPNVMQGSTVPFSVTIDGTAYSHRVDVYIDFNQDADLVDAGESFSIFAYADPTLPNTTNSSIVIPITATPGITLMRVVCVESSTSSPCGTYTWGESEYYKINITAATLCTGAPAAGTSAASPSPICAGAPSTLTLNGYTVASGITFQWQSSLTGGAPWIDISGATSTSLVVSPTSTTYYHCITTCSNGGGTATSSMATVTLNPPTACYCASSATTTGDMDIGNVTFGTMTNTSACNTLTGSYGNATGTAGMYSNFRGVAAIPNCEQGVNKPISVTIPMCTGSSWSQAVFVFIDFNQDGDFNDLSEKTNIYPYADPGADNVINANITIPATATLGNTTMRILCVESSTFSNPCGTYTWGETEDYTINIIAGVTAMTYVSSTATQLNISGVGQGSLNREIICMQVVTNGMVSPINISQLNIRTDGTMNTATDIQNAKVWSTGNSSTFATTTQYGATVAVPPAPGTDMIFSNNQPLLAGINYFWLSYDIKATATVANVVDAIFRRVTVNSIVETPTVTNPTGSRPITPPLPPNDDACGATPLTVGVGSPSYQTGNLMTTTTLSTITGPAPGCGSLAEDIWFSAVVPASGRLIIDTDLSGGPSDIDMAWYYSTNNDCNNLDNLIECDDADSQHGSMAMICRSGVLCTVPGDCAQNGTLTPGMTVYVRVWDYMGGSFGNFLIGAYEPSPPGLASVCANAEVISSIPFTSTNTTCCRGDDYKVTDGCLSLYTDGEDYLYSFTPTTNQIISISVSGTTTYTGVFVTDKCPNAGGVSCVAQQTSASGNPMLCGVSLNAGTTYYIMIDTDPGPTCTPFSITVTSSLSPTCNMAYTLSSVACNYENFFGTNIVLPIDDRFCNAYIPIGFPTCYDGYQYTGLLVSSNGYLIFDPIGCTTNLPSTNAAPNTYSGWSITAAIPNTTNAPRNAILGPWHDIDPAQGGIIMYSVQGTAPNRRLVVKWENAPLFSSSCGQMINQEIKIYETTNNIEVHIKDKVSCTSWNSGAAILGLHNYNGTQAIVPAGHNYPAVWDETNTAYRFTYACPTCITPLPVAYIDFNGKNEGPVNKLWWSTLSEKDNEYFVIEKFIDGEFQEIGRIAGAGNSNSAINYNFYDDMITNPTSYYKLKQVDFDGKFKYSDIISVNKPINFKQNVYPNPAIDVVNVLLGYDFEFVHAIVYDNLGKERINTFMNLNGSSFILNVTDLQNGMYTIKVFDGIENEILKDKIVINRN